MFVDDSACNLASLNLLRFVDDKDTFRVKEISHAVTDVLTAQEILVERRSNPTDKIKKNSHEFRPLGIGYANLGALLMSRGFPYDSDEGRAYAATITALMTGYAYKVSYLARKGAFTHFDLNRDVMLEVIQNHRFHVTKIESSFVPADLYEAAQKAWSEASHLGYEYGFRNAQVSVLAPTGTIGFMMDCDTTGVEPDIALVKYKKLAGGGHMKITNNSVPRALKNLGHTEEEIKEIVNYIKEHEKIEDAPHLSNEYLQVFDCASNL
jgi:ribonucleoside-diphosphate reductase alpha chain